MLSYRYFALGVSSVRVLAAFSFPKRARPHFAAGPQRQNRKKWLRNIAPIHSKWVFAFAETYLPRMGATKDLRKILPMSSKCVSTYAGTHLLCMGTAKIDAHKVYIPSKCASALVKTHLLGGERKNAPAQKAPMPK